MAKMMSIKDIVALGEVDRCWTHRAIKQGKLKATKQAIFGSKVVHWMVSEDDYKAWRIASRSKRPGGMVIETMSAKDLQDLQERLNKAKAHMMAQAVVSKAK